MKKELNQILEAAIESRNLLSDYIAENNDATNAHYDTLTKIDNAITLLAELAGR